MPKLKKKFKCDILSNFQTLCCCLLFVVTCRWLKMISDNVIMSKKSQPVRLSKRTSTNHLHCLKIKPEKWQGEYKFNPSIAFRTTLQLLSCSQTISTLSCVLFIFFNYSECRSHFQFSSADWINQKSLLPLLVLSCVPNREYCQQKTKKCSSIYRLLRRFQKVNKLQFGKAKKRSTLWPKNLFFKSKMDVLTALSIWDTGSL